MLSALAAVTAATAPTVGRRLVLHAAERPRRGMAFVDTIPPTVTITPAGGTFGSPSVAVTVEWCDNASLNSGTRVLTLDGASQTDTYTTGTKTGCGRYATSTLTLSLSPGSHAFYAAISDNSANQGTASATFTYAQTYTVTVTPTPSASTVASYADGQQSFSIHNSGTGDTDYTLAATCTATVIASCAVPGAVHLNSGETKTVVASYTTGTGPSSGSVTVTATAVANPATNGQGSASLTITAPPLLTLANTIAGTRDRSQCLAFAVVPGMATQCGVTRLIHGLPSVTSYGVTRTPTLVYYTDAVQGPVVGADVTVPSGSTVDSVHLYLFRQDPGGEVPVDTGRVYRSWGCTGCTQRIAALTGNYQTSIKRYRVHVRAYRGGALTDSASALTEIPQVYRVGSRFGAGWWLAGVEQLVFTQPDTGGVFWIGGDESTRKYAWARYDAASHRAYYGAPSVTRPDTLIHDTSAGFVANPWYRVLPLGDTVFFDSLGRHVRTRSRVGRTTRLYWSAGSGTDPQLDSLVLPGGFTYQWFRSDSIDSVRVRGATGLRVTKLRHFSVATYNRGDTLITDPDGNSEKYTFFSWGADYAYNGRRDRRGTTTHFEWEGYSPDMASASTPANPTQTVLEQFQNAYAKGAAPGSSPVARDQVYTQYTDPRGNVSKFWVNQLGAPVRIVNAIGKVTTLRYTDARFPGLPTEVVMPTGLVTRSWYNARGLTDSTTVFAPYGDSRNATTRIDWHPSLAVATKITHPEGDADSLTYDANTANRLSQQPGNDTTRRVTYAYNGNQQLWKIQLPGTSGYTEFLYDATLGNLSRVSSPSGYQTRYLTDSIGRDTLAQSQITPADTTHWQAEHRVLNVMDRPITVVVAGPAMNGAYAESTTVATTYNANGQPLTVTRSFTPDGGTYGGFTAATIGSLTTSWAYDSLSRVIAEYAPRRPGDATVYRDSTVYDLASNPVSIYTRRGLQITMQYDSLNRPTSRHRPSVSYARRAPTLGDAHSVDVRADSFPRLAIGTSLTTIGADVDTLRYDPSTGGLLEADNGSAKITRVYFPSGALKSEQQVVRDVADTLWGHTYLVGYGYDLDGRRTALTHPQQLTPNGSGGSTTYAYDAVTGTASTVTDLLGNSIGLGYNLRGDLTAIEYARSGFLDGHLHNGLGIDADGNLIADSLNVDRLHGNAYRLSSMTYDARGKMTRQLNSYGWSDSLNNKYSGLGRVLSSIYVATANTYADGSPYNSFESESHYGYDGLGNTIVDSSRATQASADGVTSAGWGSFTIHENTYEAGTSRLLSSVTAAPGPSTQRKGKFEYDSTGNIRQQPDSVALTWSTSEERGMYYDADNRLAAVDHRSTVKNGNLSDQQYHMVFDTYRYDALGRRVVTYSRRVCYDPNSDVAFVECRRGFIRRTVWDGNSELYEIQMPDESAWLENDTTAVQSTVADTNSGYWDTKTYFGRVAYTTGVGIDRPLGVVRMNYVSASTGSGAQPNRTKQSPHVWQAFSYFPQWNARGQVEGAWFPTVKGFVYSEAVDTTRHLLTDFYEAWYPYARENTPIAPRSWLGSLIDDKRDKTGLLYRRNRYYDPATGRFTEGDPLGLAGGLNEYGFVTGDPVNFGDPFGLKVCFAGPNAQELADSTRAATQTTFGLDSLGCATDVHGANGNETERSEEFEELANSDFIVNVHYHQASEKSGSRTDVNGVSIDKADFGQPYGTIYNYYAHCGSSLGAVYNEVSVLAHELGHAYAESQGMGKEANNRTAVDWENSVYFRRHQPMRNQRCHVPE